MPFPVPVVVVILGALALTDPDHLAAGVAPVLAGGAPARHTRPQEALKTSCDAPQRGVTAVQSWRRVVDGTDCDLGWGWGWPTVQERMDPGKM